MLLIAVFTTANTMLLFAVFTTAIVVMATTASSFKMDPSNYHVRRVSLPRVLISPDVVLVPKRQRQGLTLDTRSPLCMGATTNRLNVALDRPLPVDIFNVERSRSSLLWNLKGAWSASVRITFLASLLVGLYVSFLAITGKNIEDGRLHGLFSRIKENTLSLIERVSDAMTTEKQAVPMPFEQGSDGWGVCTLSSIKRFGKTSFYRYTFDLPDPGYILPLVLGQTVSLCCLDSEENIVQAEFFSFQPDRKSKLGSFSLLVTDPSTLPTAINTDNGRVGDFENWNEAQQAKLIHVLQIDMRIGDEIAIQPGSVRLEYRGQHIPITDVVYIAAGTGIAPVLDQIRQVLPDTSGSSVESVTIIWINGAILDFDVTSDLLEKEYNTYIPKLAVSCVLDDLEERQYLSENKEINDAVATFQPGTMAVLSGPSASMKKALTFLQENKSFPRECICIL